MSRLKERNSKPWYKRWWGILIILLLSWYLILGLFMVSMALSGVRISDSGNQTDEASVAGSTQLSKSDQKLYVQESLSTILSKFGSNSGLTDLQKERLWSDYENKLTKAKIYVYSVDKDIIGRVVMLADLSPRGQYDLASDFRIYFLDSEIEKLYEVGKNDLIEVEGKLTGYGSIMGDLIEISDAKIISLDTLPPDELVFEKFVKGGKKRFYNFPCSLIEDQCIEIGDCEEIERMVKDGLC